MRKAFILSGQMTLLALMAVLIVGVQSCQEITTEVKETVITKELPEYFLLRPEVEKLYGYSHAVRIGDDLKISGAVSMDDAGNLTVAGDMEQQMKNCYSDLEKILKHYGYTFDDVVVENVFTTDMAEFIRVSGYRNSIYTKQFPTGTWLEVKGLALPGQLIEIDMEAHKSK
jgi:enamine deaminase RidA (YjgF/YER057c/UK114 family)